MAVYELTTDLIEVVFVFASYCTKVTLSIL